MFDPDAGSQRLIVGQLSRRVLPLGEEAVCQGHLPPVASGPALREAGDALSAELEEITAAICGNDRLFSRDVCELLGAESFDRVVALESIELLPAVRGHGVGAWASATSICALTQGIATLLVTKAAPLHREDFIGDPDRRDLTPDEDGAWRTAQTSISAQWRRTLGLRPLPQNPQVLIGSGHIDPGGLNADACHWNT